MQPQAQTVTQGVPVADLCRYRIAGPRRGRAIISARELEDWLISQGFAERVSQGRLRPTRKAHDVVFALSPWD